MHSLKVTGLEGKNEFWTILSTFAFFPFSTTLPATLLPSSLPFLVSSRTKESPFTMSRTEAEVVAIANKSLGGENVSKKRWGVERRRDALGRRWRIDESNQPRRGMDVERERERKIFPSRVEESSSFFLLRAIDEAGGTRSGERREGRGEGREGGRVELDHGRIITFQACSRSREHLLTQFFVVR